MKRLKSANTNSVFLGTSMFFHRCGLESSHWKCGEGVKGRALSISDLKTSQNKTKLATLR